MRLLSISNRSRVSLMKSVLSTNRPFIRFLQIFKNRLSLSVSVLGFKMVHIPHCLRKTIHVCHDLPAFFPCRKLSSPLLRLRRSRKKRRLKKTDLRQASEIRKCLYANRRPGHRNHRHDKKLFSGARRRKHEAFDLRSRDAIFLILALVPVFLTIHRGSDGP